MKANELKALEKVFAAEIDAALSGEPLIALVQSKAKVFRTLEQSGHVEFTSITLKGFPPVTVSGWTLTHLGRMEYCMSCKDDGGEG